MTHYKAIFFDLDNTLFSFDEMYKMVSKAAMEQILGNQGIQISFEEFYVTFRRIADELYGEYEMGERTMESYQDERWLRTFQFYEIPLKDDTLTALNRYIMTNYLGYVKPFEGVRNILGPLSKQNPLGLITNGPVKMQMSKLQKMNLLPFFDPKLIIISEEMGVSKPSPDIFHSALKKAGVKPTEALHIGDSIKHDIVGAIGVGMDSALIHTDCRISEVTPTYCFEDFFAAAKTLLDNRMKSLS